MKNVIRLWFVPILALGIAVNQQLRSHNGNLSPWKGGGMGMFSDIQSPNTRKYRIFVDIGSETYAASIRGHLKKPIAIIRTEPSQATADRIVRTLAQHSWCINEDRKAEIFWKDNCRAPKAANGIRFHLFQIEYSSSSATISYHMVLQASA